MVEKYLLCSIEEDCKSNQNSSRYAPPIRQFLKKKKQSLHFKILHSEDYFENEDLEHKGKDDVPSFPQNAHLKNKTIIQFDT